MAALDDDNTLARVARTFTALRKVDTDDFGGQQQPDARCSSSSSRAKPAQPAKERLGREGREKFEPEVETVLNHRLKGANQERLLDVPRRGEDSAIKLRAAAVLLPLSKTLWWPCQPIAVQCVAANVAAGQQHCAVLAG
jgi:hypothetical protein